MFAASARRGLVISLARSSRLSLRAARAPSADAVALRRAPRRSLCSGAGSAPGSAGGERWTRFWVWTTQERPHWRSSAVEGAVAFTVFGVTGSTSVAVVRPMLKSTIGLEGSWRDGPNSYRVLSIVLVSPIYATLLVFFGTVAGRHRFFASMAGKIFGRFLPRAATERISRAFGYCFPGSLRRAPPPP